ncbi:hypothetical protein BHM03_00056979 [Ensete ventricosum]|nr:hypothetical protein BHM03_00056979 [Ensete ventricosum]
MHSRQASPKLGRSLLSRMYHLRRYLYSSHSGWQGAAQDAAHFKPKEILRLKHWTEVSQVTEESKLTTQDK